MRIKNQIGLMLFLLCASSLVAQTADQRADYLQDATNTIFMSPDKSYYKQNSAAITDPYGYGYWTQSHTLETLADAFQRTRNTVYVDRMKSIIAGIRKYNLYGQGTYTNDYYDDLEWLCLAAFNCYNATKDTEFLNAVHDIWAEIKTGYANGAVAWKKGCSTTCNNSISNGPAIVIAAKLYQLEGDAANLQMAKTIHAWMKANVLNAQGGIWDSPTNTNPDWQFSYNTGMFIAGCLELSLVTGQQSYIDDGIKASEFMMNYRKFNGGAFYLNETGQGDGGLFKGIFAKWFIEFVRVGNLPQARKDHYLQIINYTADYVWSHAVSKTNYLINDNWKKLPTGSIDLSTQTSGLHLFESVASLNKVHIYQNSNYGGFYSQLAPGTYTTAQLFSKGTPDNYISSLTVPKGYTVTVYENDNLGGASTTFTGNMASLDTWNDRISSIKITDNNVPVTTPVPAESAVANVFQDVNFNGYNVTLDVGDYTLAQLQERGVANNDITSLKVIKGFKVTLYDGDNFTGDSKDFTSDTGWIDTWNDKASSLRVRANGDATFGGIYTIENLHSALNLEVAGASQSNGASAVQSWATGADNQKFTITPLGDGLYKIIAKHSGQSLTIDDCSTDNGALMSQNPYIGSPNQQFVLMPTANGYYKIIPRISGKLVEVSNFSTDFGAKVQQWEDVNSQGSGQWKLVKVGSLAVDEYNGITASLSIYPNPAIHTLFFSSDMTGAQVNVFSQLGSFVAQQTVKEDNSVDVSKLQTGAYLMVITKGEKKITKKFLKKQ